MTTIYNNFWLLNCKVLRTKGCENQDRGGRYRFVPRKEEIPDAHAY